MTSYTKTNDLSIFEIKALRKVCNISKSAILNSTINAIFGFQMALFLLFTKKGKNIIKNIRLCSTRGYVQCAWVNFANGTLY